MHPARHRAMRELGAFSKQMADHWSALAQRLDLPALADGAEQARALLGELRPLATARDLEIGPAALGAGRVARVRPPVPDAALERNQALRFALLDAEHLIVLTEYVGGLSSAEGDEELAEACTRWRDGVRKPAQALRRAVRALARDPDAAVEPLSKAARIPWLIGWLGEATDRRAGRS